MAVHAVAEIHKLIRTRQTTIVFVNTRAQAEIIFQALWRENDENLPIALHHGSLAREQRRKVEAAMARGERLSPYSDRTPTEDAESFPPLAEAEADQVDVRLGALGRRAAVGVTQEGLDRGAHPPLVEMDVEQLVGEHELEEVAQDGRVREQPEGRALQRLHVGEDCDVVRASPK